MFFVLNRESAGPVDLTIDLRGFPQIKSGEAFKIAGADLLATNTAQKPDAVQPHEHQEFTIQSDTIRTPLNPLSWNLLSLSY